MALTKAETLFFSSIFLDYRAALPALNREVAKRTRNIRGGRPLARSKRALAFRQGANLGAAAPLRLASCSIFIGAMRIELLNSN